MSGKAYQTIIDDHFPRYFFSGFTDNPQDLDVLKATAAQVCLYEKVVWRIPNEEGEPEERGLRYGENPGQEAALYRPVNGHLILAGIEFLGPGKSLTGGLDESSLMQFGKHPGKINLTDIDSALAILKYFHEDPCAVIIKHNNPSGVALGGSLAEAYTKAFEADPIAPFGGVLAVNRTVDAETAKLISEEYYEVVCAPEFGEGAFDILSKRKNLRIVKIAGIDRLHDYVGSHYLETKSLMDGSLIHQWSYVPAAGKEAEVIRSFEDFKRLVEIPSDIPERDMQDGRMVRTGRNVSIERPPSEDEFRDLWFAWMVETGVISNSVLTAKNGATVSIGVGGQDRVMMAKQCVSKAFESRRALIAKRRFGVNFDALGLQVREGKHPPAVLCQIEEAAKEGNAGLEGAVAASDAFFPFRDGVDALLDRGVKAIVQPGGSLRDADAAKACNEKGATMVFTHMRCFKH